MRIAVRRPRSEREPVLWVIDAEQWPRACLCAELIERGYDPRGFLTVADALDWLAQGAPKPEAIILELRGQNLTEGLVESIRSLGSPTILLGGITEMNDRLVQNQNWDTVLRRPFTVGAVVTIVQGLVTRE